MGRWARPGRPRPLAAHSALCLVERGWLVAGDWGGGGRETWERKRGRRGSHLTLKGKGDTGGHSHTKQKIKLNKS